MKGQLVNFELHSPVHSPAKFFDCDIFQRRVRRRRQLGLEVSRLLGLQANILSMVIGRSRIRFPVA